VIEQMENWKQSEHLSLWMPSCLLGNERVMETLAEFHFSWVHTFSAKLSSLPKCTSHDRYRLRPTTPAQLCWSSSRTSANKTY